MLGKAAVPVRQQADQPGPVDAGETRREAVHGNHRSRFARSLALVEKAADRAVERLVNFGEPLPARCLGQTCVGRDHRAVARFREAVGRLEGSVAIDDKPAVALQEKRCVEKLGHGPRQSLRPDVVGDVAIHLRGGDAEVAQTPWNGAPGMFAGQHERRRTRQVDGLDRRPVRGAQQRAVLRYYLQHCLSFKGSSVPRR